MNQLHFGLAASLLILFSGYAQACNQDQVSASAKFDQYDMNHDGVLSKQEALHAGVDAQHFSIADKNQDGSLDKNEFALALAGQTGHPYRRFIDDSILTTKVKTVLLEHEKLNSLEVHVQSHYGKVRLTGTVDNKLQKLEIAKITAGVKGVNQVVDELKVKG